MNMNKMKTSSGPRFYSYTMYEWIRWPSHSKNIPVRQHGKEITVNQPPICFSPTCQVRVSRLTKVQRLFFFFFSFFLLLLTSAFCQLDGPGAHRECQKLITDSKCSWARMDLNPIESSWCSWARLGPNSITLICQNRCQIECQIPDNVRICQIECQTGCQIECQVERQMECQNSR